MVNRKTAENIATAVILILSRVLVVEYIVGFIAWYYLADGYKDLSGTPLGADFLNVYAAVSMAHNGLAPLIYDWTAHGHAEQTIVGYNAPYFGWHYPPMFLVLASVLALFPYLWAFALYMGTSFLGYWAVIRRILPHRKEYVWAFLAFPGVFANVINGQNGFITTALFGGGFIWLDEAPLLSGVMFGLLSYKPQFFIIIPFMLAIGGYTRALMATLGVASANILLSWAVYGTATWSAFFSSAPLTQHIILEQGSTGWKKIQSVFSLARMWGADISTAYSLQFAVAIMAVGVTSWIWRSKPPLATKAASLCACLLLTTPYLLDYDLVILSVPLAFLIRQGIQNGFIAYEKIILFFLWLLPLLARNLGGVFLPLTPPLLVALLVVSLLHARENKYSPLPV